MKVVTSGPIPPEHLAYTLARYSRSADDFQTSLNWVKSNDSSKFLESFYFQYGHGSIADLGHLAISFEDISEAAAIEIVDEQLWDGQQRSTRYQDFSKAEPVIPPDFGLRDKNLYVATHEKLMTAYRTVHWAVQKYLMKAYPQPDGMATNAYDRAVHARAFDSARYLLPLGNPTSVGQVTSIRTLEKQIQRWLISNNAEVRQIAEATIRALQLPPAVTYSGQPETQPIAPTLAKYVRPNNGLQNMENTAVRWLESKTFAKMSEGIGPSFHDENSVSLYLRQTPSVQTAACLLYPLTFYGYGQLATMFASRVSSAASELIEQVMEARSKYLHTELPRAFRNQPYVFEITCDIGAYRDLHRHRRCQQILQPFSTCHGWETPPYVQEAGVYDVYVNAMQEAAQTYSAMWHATSSTYILPFGYRCRFLMNMDFAEVEYICKLRSGVKGHPSYRRIAWQMKEAFRAAEPVLGKFVTATSPDVEDPLTR